MALSQAAFEDVHFNSFASFSRFNLQQTLSYNEWYANECIGQVKESRWLCSPHLQLMSRTYLFHELHKQMGPGKGIISIYA